MARFQGFEIPHAAIDKICDYHALKFRSERKIGVKQIYYGIGSLTAHTVCGILGYGINA